MRRCDGVYLIPGWQKSSGARAEAEEAVQRGMPIFQSLDELGVALKRPWPSLFIRRYGSIGVNIAIEGEGSR
jgi:hypothetical protein